MGQEEKPTFEMDTKIMEMYSLSARSFNQLSSAAIAVTIVFSEKVIGTKGPIDTSSALLFTWLLFLISIGCGMFYQYFAIKFLEQHHLSEYTYKATFLSWFTENPGRIYGIMMATFLSGACMLVFTAFRGLLS